MKFLISFILIYIDDVHSIIPSEGLVCGGLVLNKINLFSIARFDCQVKQSSERIATCWGKGRVDRSHAQEVNIAHDNIILSCIIVI